MKFINDILTDEEGDWDIVSVLAAVATTVFIGLTIYTVVWKDKDIDGVGYGAAVASLLGTLGGAYYLKSRRDPGGKG